MPRDGSRAGHAETFEVTLRKRRGSRGPSKERYPGFSHHGTRYRPRWSRKGVAAVELAEIEARAREDRLALEAVPTRYTRSSDYRKRFEEANPGPWRCRYCNKKIGAGEMTVDHIVPVAAAGKSRLAQKALEKMGADNVNDLANLAPACSECNARKGAKGGMWVARGVLGGNSWYWPAVRAAQCAAALLLVAALVLVLGGKLVG